MTDKHSSIEAHIAELAEMKLVGFRVVCEGSQYAEEIPKVVKKLYKYLDEIRHLVYPIKQVGAFVAKEKSKDEDGYWVCFEVTDYERVPEEMVTLTVPPQSYAVTTYRGEASGIFHAYDALHEWVKQQGYTRQPSLWSLEIYSQSDVDEAIVELCDPIMNQERSDTNGDY